MTLKDQRMCANGHRYIKSSTCPVCPVCESLLKPTTGFQSKLSAPARRALDVAGIRNLEQLGEFTEHEINNLHGIGKKVIGILKTEMKQFGIAFKGNNIE